MQKQYSNLISVLSTIFIPQAMCEEGITVQVICLWSLVQMGPRGGLSRTVYGRPIQTNSTDSVKNVDELRRVSILSGQMDTESDIDHIHACLNIV